MARTRGTLTRYRPRSGRREIQQMEKFEQKMRKYYPKKSKFFYNGSHYQPSRADNFENPNSLVPQRYKRDFFRSFYADLTRRAPEPSKIPQNLQVLTIFAGSEIVLRKLIKQNKRLKHLVLASWNDELNAKVVKYLKYSKNLCSIMFQRGLPDFSETQCKKMLKTWGKTLESFERHGLMPKRNEADSKGAMEAILMFPKLKFFQFDGGYFPFEKLQARDIAYNIKFDIFAFNSLVKEFPESKPIGNVIIPLGSSDYKSDKMSLETRKFQKKSNKTLSFDFGNPRACHRGGPLLPVFQNVSSLDLIIPEHKFKFKCSSLGQLNNLTHLSAWIDSAKEQKLVEDFFSYLNKNVAPHKKLETFLIKVDFEKKKEEEEDDDDDEEEEEKEEKEEKDEKKEEANSEDIVHFFEACSQNLKTVHFEFNYLDKKSEYPELFYQGLSKLESLQSLSLCLCFFEFKSKAQVNKLCKIISGIKSLKELDFKLLERDPKEKQVNLTFPPQLKKLSVGMDTPLAPFNTSKTFGPLTNLIHLELEFADFSSPKWGKILSDIIDKLKVLEVLMLKKTEKFEYENGKKREKVENEYGIMKERLDKLMKESSNLKLMIFVNMRIKDIMILKRNYSWSEINPIIDDLSVEKGTKVNYIKSYA